VDVAVLEDRLGALVVLVQAEVLNEAHKPVQQEDQQRDLVQVVAHPVQAQLEGLTVALEDHQEGHLEAQAVAHRGQVLEAVQIQEVLQEEDHHKVVLHKERKLQSASS
tara:strand:+ start:38 stop:361 length:324 start_codon:yes stop_codon:yes gene_type:complete